MEPKPKIDFKTILLTVSIGFLLAVGVYQANQNGLLPKNFRSQLPQLQIKEETKTTVKEESAIIDVVEKVSASVVAIGVNRRVVNPFDPFALPKREDSTIGTGFVVSENGIIATNKHVVLNQATKYTVITKDGEKFEVTKVFRDPTLDLALIQIEAKGLKPLTMGDSSKLRVGQTAIAIGNALGRFTNTVTTGIVSGLGRKVTAGDPYSGEAESLDNLIQTDAAINPGNSGGPLLDVAGNVIGVNVATTEGAQNIGFAIAINTVKPIVEEFLKNGSISRPFLGIRYRFIAKDIAILNEVPQGAYIQEVIDGGPADKAKIEPGDIVIKINGQIIDSENKISEIISKSKIGSDLELTIWREDKELKVTAKVEESPNL